MSSLAYGSLPWGNVPPRAPFFETVRNLPVPSHTLPTPTGRGRPLSAYDAIAELYDPWSRSVTEDVGFYVAEARKAGGTIVELGVGTGRIAVPVASAGVPVIGVDSSAGMLEVCRRRADAAGVARLLDLRQGDLRDPPVTERVRLVTSPFRALLHAENDADRRAALAAAHRLLVPGGRFVFDVFAPSPEDIAGDERPLARTRAGHLGARRLGHGAPRPHPAGSAATRPRQP